MPKTPTAVCIGAKLGSIFLIVAGVAIAYSCQPNVNPSTISPSLYSLVSDLITLPTAPPTITSPSCKDAAITFCSTHSSSHIRI